MSREYLYRKQRLCPALSMLPNQLHDESRCSHGDFTSSSCIYCVQASEEVTVGHEQEQNPFVEPQSSEKEKEVPPPLVPEPVVPAEPPVAESIAFSRDQTNSSSVRHTPRLTASALAC